MGFSAQIPRAGEATRLWQAALGRLQIELPRANYDTWLRDTTGLSVDDTSFVVAVPSIFAAEWLEQRLSGLAETAIASVLGRRVQIVFRVPAEASPQLDPFLPDDSTPNDTPDAVHPLNGDYIFANFVVGPSNQLAHAAARAICTGGKQAYNPLFVYSSFGLGKTHLLQAVAHSLQTTGKLARYVTAEQFTNEFVLAIQSRHTDAFRSRYRESHTLLIDDIQFLSGKEQTQEGLFHTFNVLHNAHRQIVIASDRPPHAIPRITDRLQSRFEWGLLTDIQPPDFEMRLAILRHRAADSTRSISDDVLTAIAEQPIDNVRQLQSVINRIIALADFTGTPITPNLLDCTPTAPLPQSAPTPQALIALIEQDCSLPAGTAASQRRDRQATGARYLAAHLMTVVLGLPLEEIGQHLGHRDRTTIAHGIRRFRAEVETSPSIQRRVNRLYGALNG